MNVAVYIPFISLMAFSALYKIDNETIASENTYPVLTWAFSAALA